jgi:hypothetical protein
MLTPIALSASSAAKLKRLGADSCNTFAVDEQTYITAKHCVLNLLPEDFKIVLDDKLLQVIKVEKHTDHDLARLTVEKTVVDHAVMVGEYSSESNSYIQINGLFSPIETIEIPANGRTIFLHTGITEPGSSGSPIIQNGLAVGMHIGVVTLDKHNFGVFLPFNKLSESHGILNIETQAVPVALATAGAWCIANSPICIALIGSATTITMKGIDLVVAYLNSLPDAKTAELQGALQQCNADKEQITKDIKNMVQEIKEGKTGNTYHEPSPSRSSSVTLPSELGAVDPDREDLSTIPMRCFWINGKYVCYAVQSAFSETTPIFVNLARLAFIHKFMSESGRGPTLQEVQKASGVMFSGYLSMDEVYQYAIRSPSPAATPAPRPGSSACVVRGCPIER